MKVQRAIVVTLTSALTSDFKVLRQRFYVMGKALSGELYCTGTGLVLCDGSAVSGELSYMHTGLVLLS